MIPFQMLPVLQNVSNLKPANKKSIKFSKTKHASVIFEILFHFGVNKNNFITLSISFKDINNKVE